MPQGMKDVVLLGKETTRGTVAGSFPLHQPFLGDGLVPTLTKNLGEILSSSTWPYRTDQVPLGAMASLALTPDINVATIRDLIELATKRTAGDQQSVSIKHSRAGVADAQYLGAVVAQLAMQYSRSGSPDQSSILQGTMQLECMQPATASGVSAGTQGAGRRFQIGAATFTINSAGALEVLEYSRTTTIEHALGPTGDNNNTRLYLGDGALDEEITITARFTAAAWTALVLGEPDAPVVIVHATGGANETVTETIGKAQISTHQLAQSDGEVTEQITIKPFHTGSADPTVWSYGSEIGASVLGL